MWRGGIYQCKIDSIHSCRSKIVIQIIAQLYNLLTNNVNYIWVNLPVIFIGGY